MKKVEAQNAPNTKDVIRRLGLRRSIYFFPEMIGHTIAGVRGDGQAHFCIRYRGYGRSSSLTDWLLLYFSKSSRHLNTRLKKRGYIYIKLIVYNEIAI